MLFSYDTQRNIKCLKRFYDKVNYNENLEVFHSLLRPHFP